MGELGASIWLELAHASSIIILSNEPDAYTPHPYQHIPLNPISTYPSLVALFYVALPAISGERRRLATISGN